MYQSMQKSRKPAQAGKNAGAPRGRPRGFDRKTALSRATHLFWAKGYEATSIADLTEVMGIGSPSLYAAFGSKEALYAEALRHYGENYEGFVWANFLAAPTAREAVESLLLDSAAALTGERADIPRGCMVTLSTVGSEGHAELGELVRAARTVALERLKERLQRAIAEGELPRSTDVHARARFVQAVQSGMSLLARDGASCSELEAVARVALLSWDATDAAL